MRLGIQKIVLKNPLFIVLLSSSSTYHNAGDISRLKSWNGKIQGLEHAVVDALTDETVEVDGTSQELNVTLTKKRHVTIGRWSVDERT